MSACANEIKPYKLSQLPAVARINRVLDSPRFLLVIALVTLLSHVFSKELLMYAFTALLMLYLGVFGTDFRLMLPLLVNCYITPAAQNNPGLHETTVFSAGSGALILVMAGVSLLFFAVRCHVDGELGLAALRRRLALLTGFLWLGAAFFLSGIGAHGYTAIAGRNLAFAGMQLAAFVLPYLALGIGVRWEEIDRDYLATVGLLAGLVVGAQVLNIYRVASVFQPGGVDRSRIFLGWGNYNNVAAMIAMAVPFAFYFIYEGKCVILNNLLAAFLCVCAVLSCSRAGILGTCAIYCFSALVVFVTSRSRRARQSAFVGLIFALLVLSVAVLAMQDLLAAAFANGLASKERIALYKEGLASFAEYPIFGYSFFRLNDLVAAGGEGSWIFSQVAAFNSFFPGRWHNTLVQLLASCGVAGLAAYAFHRYQTLRLLLEKPNAVKGFAAISIGVLLLLSMVDSHLFNVGPTLFYSCALAFAENKNTE